MTLLLLIYTILTHQYLLILAVHQSGIDSHGAGAVRFDTKHESGPAGEDKGRFYNYVRLVRNTK